MFTSQYWTTIARLAGRQAAHIEAPGSKHRDENNFFYFLKNDSFRKLPELSKRKCDYFSKTDKQYLSFFSVYRLGTWSRDPRIPGRSNYSLDHWCSILFLPSYKRASYLFHVSSSDFTTVEMNAIARTLNNSCSQSLARKRDSWKLESMFSKHFRLNLTGTKP